MKKTVINIFLIAFALIGMAFTGKCFAAQAIFINNGTKNIEVSYKFIHYVKKEGSKYDEFKASPIKTSYVLARHDSINANYSLFQMPDSEEGIVIYSVKSTEGFASLTEYITEESKFAPGATCMSFTDYSLFSPGKLGTNISFIFDDNNGSPLISCRTNNYANTIRA